MLKTATTTEERIDARDLGIRGIDVPSLARVFRALVGALAIGAFTVNFMLAQWSIHDARESDASAIQIVQVWTPHIYYAILITGVAVALYVASRLVD
jgi:hypothetical protein